VRSFTIFSIPTPQREAVRLAILATEAEGLKATVRRVRERSEGLSTEAIAYLLRAVAAGWLAPQVPWDGRVAVVDLESAIRNATSHEDRTRIHQEVAARVASGAMSPVVAKSLQDSLSAARLSAKAEHDDLSATRDTEPLYLLDESSFLVAKVVNRIASPRILQEVMHFVFEAGERDLKEFPNPTADELEALRGPQGGTRPGSAGRARL